MVRAVVAGEGDRLREIRLESLRQDPDAFASTLDEELRSPDEWWTGWAALSQEGVTQRTFVVCDAADAWQGLALVRLDAARPGVAVINAMWVAPAVRRQGHSRALCEACAQWAVGAGAGALVLEVVEGNLAAQSAYESCGFAVTGETTVRIGGRKVRELVLARAL